MNTTEEARFWPKVQKTDACWLWTASTSNEGYGKFGREGKRGWELAHRVSFVHARGQIPDGKILDHICMNRMCVRPQHLRVVTDKQNNEHRSGAQRNSRSGIRGVAWNPARGCWVGRVRHNKRDHWIRGRYATAEEAEVAVRALRAALFTHDDYEPRDANRPPAA